MLFKKASNGHLQKPLIKHFPFLILKHTKKSYKTHEIHLTQSNYYLSIPLQCHLLLHICFKSKKKHSNPHLWQNTGNFHLVSSLSKLFRSHFLNNLSRTTILNFLKVSGNKTEIFIFEFLMHIWTYETRARGYLLHTYSNHTKKRWRGILSILYATKFILLFCFANVTRKMHSVVHISTCEKEETSLVFLLLL